MSTSLVSAASVTARPTSLYVRQRDTAAEKARRERRFDSAHRGTL